MHKSTCWETKWNCRIHWTVTLPRRGRLRCGRNGAQVIGNNGAAGANNQDSLLQRHRNGEDRFGNNAYPGAKNRYEKCTGQFCQIHNFAGSTWILAIRIRRRRLDIANNFNNWTSSTEGQMFSTCEPAAPFYSKFEMINFRLETFDLRSKTHGTLVAHQPCFEDDVGELDGPVASPSVADVASQCHRSADKNPIQHSHATTLLQWCGSTTLSTTISWQRRSFSSSMGRDKPLLRNCAPRRAIRIQS
jgi:hypothetical protein